MALSPGTRLGPYEIQSVIGAGGMGVVYRARDTRLDRTVAIKILPDALAADPQFRDRFDREARTISQFTHPNICTLYDVGEHDGTSFLVMELLDGETLENRCARATARGSGLPLDEALRIAIQIADALAAAHRRGIVHRDLKPGNIFLARSSGASAPPIAKLLDFGLAKLRPAGPAVSGLSMAATAPSPVTSAGTILGTLPYMAPELVEGQDADTRTDLFAFGCVLYEMLTAKRPFEGKTPASLIAAILDREPPPVATLQPLAPPLVDAIIRRCLAKNADDRWQSAADLASALRWVVDSATASAPPAPPTAWRRTSVVAALAALTGVALAAGVWFGWRYASSGTAPAASALFEVQPPTGVTLSPSPVAAAAQLALSADGRHLAFIGAAKGGPSQIWIRPLDSGQAQPLAGTDGASFPFWSPDSRFIAFFAAGKLKTIDTRGGTPQTLADAAAGRGGSWNAEGVIVFAAQSNSSISRVSASGGSVTPVTTFNPDHAIFTQYWPQFLPDGRHFLYYQRSAKAEHQGVYVMLLGSSQSTRVLETSTRAVYASGHLLFVRDGILFAQAFDDRALQTSGEPIRLADGVGYLATAFAYSAVTASSSGVLAHGPNVMVTTSLRWRDRGGATVGPPIAPRPYSSPRLSPDQTGVMVSITDVLTTQPDLWLLALARGTVSRVTSDRSSDWFPAWSHDGSHVFFGSARNGSTTVFQKAGVAPEEQFADNARAGNAAAYPTDASQDGRFLLCMLSTSRGYDLSAIPLFGDRKPTPFLAGPFNEVQGRFSPNGRWVAYASDESGKFEVYVRPFPAENTQSTAISIAGGMQPEWRGDGQELFYISADGKLTAVPVVTDAAALRAGEPRALFAVEVPEPIAPYQTDYAVTADGQRFLVNTVVEQPTRPSLTVILNWTAGLKK
jgi:Tol biopolymer transport system component